MSKLKYAIRSPSCLKGSELYTCKHLSFYFTNVKLVSHIPLVLYVCAYLYIILKINNLTTYY